MLENMGVATIRRDTRTLIVRGWRHLSWMLMTRTFLLSMNSCLETGKNLSLGFITFRRHRELGQEPKKDTEMRKRLTPQVQSSNKREEDYSAWRSS